jgi:hypothetical protein
MLSKTVNVGTAIFLLGTGEEGRGVADEAQNKMR